MSELHVEPMALDEVVSLFRSAAFPWWIAGGWGLDLFLGTHSRPHDDVDVLVLRRDQFALQTHLIEWDLRAADPPGKGSLRPWNDREDLQLPVHEVWGRRQANDAWQLQIVLAETTNGEWMFRRNPSVKLPLDSFGLTSLDGIPYVAPAVLLLFKAKHLRAKDEQDFANVVPKLDADDRLWLRDAMVATYPEHPWLHRL